MNIFFCNALAERKHGCTASLRHARTKHVAGASAAARPARVTQLRFLRASNLACNSLRTLKNAAFCSFGLTFSVFVDDKKQRIAPQWRWKGATRGGAAPAARRPWRGARRAAL